MPTHNPDYIFHSTKRIMAVVLTLGAIVSGVLVQAGWAEPPDYLVYLYLGIPLGYAAWSIASDKDKVGKQVADLLCQLGITKKEE